MANVTTPANYFHLLLRHPAAKSPLWEFDDQPDDKARPRGRPLAARL